MTVRVRGIYATALTDLFREDPGVTLVSDAIADRFDTEFPTTEPTAAIETTDDRQGVGVVGDRKAVGAVRERVATLGRDALAWADPTPRGAVYAGDVAETLGGGAVVDLGDGEGYLPYGNAADRIETGDRVRVQVAEPAAPWTGGRPVLDETIRAHGALADLVRGASARDAGPALGDLLPTDPLEGWAVRWADREDADLDALEAALSGLNDRAAALDDALAAADHERGDPRRLATDEVGAWVWFGRETRFALDDRRRHVTTTIPGHHRIKAGSGAASAGVDLAEALVEAPDGAFPVGVVLDQFGPAAGDSLSIVHGKPDGRRVELGEAEVVDLDRAGTVELRREMTGGGTYDGLGVERRAGDVATTKVTEGRWWYPTTYESAEGEARGTYVNVCTPVELFPDAVRYVDLHVDVVKHTDGTVERLDDDELDAAVEAGHVSEALAEKAREVAASVVHGLS